MTDITQKSSEKTAKKKEDQQRVEQNKTIEKKLTTAQENELLNEFGFSSFLTSGAVKSEQQTAKWKEDRNSCLALLSSLKATQHNQIDCVKQGSDYLKQLKQSELFKSLNGNISAEQEKKLTKRLQTIAQLDTKKMGVIRQKFLDENKAPETEEALFESMYQKYEKMSLVQRKASDIKLLETLSFFNDTADVVIAITPKSVRREIGAIFNIQFNDQELGELKKLSPDEIKQQPKMIQEWLEVAYEEQELLKVTKLVLDEFKKTPSELTDQNKNGMQPSQTNRSRWSRFVAGFEHILDQANDLPHRMSRAIHRVFIAFPRVAKYLLLIIQVIFFMVYLGVIKMPLFEYIRSGPAADLNAQFLSRNVTLPYISNQTNQTWELRYGRRDGNSTFREGAMTDIHNNDKAFIFASCNFVLQSLLNIWMCFSFKDLSRSTVSAVRWGYMGLVSIVIGSIATVLAQLISTSTSDITNAVFNITEMSCVYWGLLYRGLLALVVKVAPPPPSSNRTLVANVSFYMIGQKLTVQFMPSATKTAIGVIGNDALRERVGWNSSMEAPYALTSLITFYWQEGISFEFLPWYPDPTPKEPNPGFRRVKRAAFRFFSTIAVVGNVYGVAFLIGASLLGWMGVLPESLIILIITLALGVGVFSASALDTTPHEPEQAMLGSSDEDQDLKIRYDNGQVMRKTAIKKHLQSGKPYKVGEKLYQIERDGYGDIDFETGLQMTEDQSNRRVRYVDQMVSKDSSRYHLPIELKDLRKHIEQGKTYKTNNLSVNYFQGQDGYGDIDFETGLQRAPQAAEQVAETRATSQVQQPSTSVGKRTKDVLTNTKQSTPKNAVAKRVVKEEIPLQNRFSVLSEVDETNNQNKQKNKKSSTSSSEGSLLEPTHIYGVPVPKSGKDSRTSSASSNSSSIQTKKVAPLLMKREVLNKEKKESKV